MIKHLLTSLFLAAWHLPIATAQMTLSDYLQSLPELDTDQLPSNTAQFSGKRTVEITYDYQRAPQATSTSEPGNLVPAKYLKTVTIPGGGPKGYAWEQFIRDPQGKPILLAYTDNAGKLMRGPHVWAACLCSYSPEGQLTALTYLDTAKKPMMVSDSHEPIKTTCGTDSSNKPVLATIVCPGYATLQFAYDHLKRIQGITFLDKDGNKVNNSLGYAEERITYGEPGGCIARREYYNKEGDPVRTGFGYHAVIYNYLLPPGVNELNNKAAEESGPENQIKKEMGKMGGGIKKLSNKVGIPALATASLLTGIHYLDEKKKPAKHLLGHSSIKFEYDAAGEPLKTTWQDDQDKPVNNAWGFASLQYDRTRYLTKIICLDKQDHPVVCSGGFAAQGIEYNPDGQLKEISFYGKDTKTSILGPKGWATKQFLYKKVKDQNVLSEIAHFDESAAKVVCPDGYHIQKMEYDLDGKLIGETFEGVNNNRLFGPNGYACAKYTYIKVDNSDRLLSIEYFDPENTPCLNREGYSKIYYEYDERGKCRKHVFCDTEGSIGTTPWNYISMELKTNNEGREIKRSYKNGMGLPCYGPEQASDIIRTYDDLNRPLTIKYKNPIDGDALTPGRYSKITYKYGDNGLDFSVTYDGGDPNPSNLNSEGYHKRNVFWCANDKPADYAERFTDAQDNSVLVRNLYATRYVKLAPDGQPGTETYLGVNDEDVPGMRYIYPGVNPHANRMASLEETSRRLFLKQPDKRMEDITPFDLLKAGSHYGEEIASTLMIENVYPVILDRIPQGIPEGSIHKKFNARGQLGELDHPYPTAWNFTHEEFQYDKDGYLIKRILSSPDDKDRKKLKSDNPEEELKESGDTIKEKGKSSEPGRAAQEEKADSPFGSIVPDEPSI